ncbi:MAG: sugar phosphate isomerase/epimerase [Cyclobacteriaceae bacterium]|nr:sugar phosphate isomerase/epimerase [Cyclobacteriaceae bacterium]
MKEKTRRDFLKISGLTAAASFVSLNSPKAKISVKKSKLKLGLASYSLRKFNQEETIAMAKRAWLDYMCFKSMHLPLDSTIDELKIGAKKVKEAGQQLYGGGVIYMKSKEQVDQAFEYAKNAGMSVIVGVPEHELLDYTNDKIKQYDIKVAIHNHGPGDETYPSPESVYEKIKDLDSRFGLCMDIGHTQRIGIDPTEAAKKYFSRLFDIHIKDVDKAKEDGKTVEIGRGVIDIPKFLKLLVDRRYEGVVSFEYEKDAEDPLPGLSESVGYVKGCLDSIA